MATTKKPTPSKSTAIVPWEAEMQAAAMQQKKNEKVFAGFAGINFTSSGIMMIDKKPVKDNKLDVVVLAAVHLNQYYESDYNPTNPTVPTCYAYGDETLGDADAIEEGMAPADSVEDKQNDRCKGCPQNEFGTAKMGRGKACKNNRRLIVVAADAMESVEDFNGAEQRSFNIPVTSTRNWAVYLNDVLGELNRPYYAVVTTISTKPSVKTQYEMSFEFKEAINFDQGLWDLMKKKTADAMKAAVAPFPKQADLDKLQGRDGGKGAPRQIKGQRPVKVPVVAAKSAPAKKAAAKSKGR